MFLFLLFSFFSCCAAFGAGNIPNYAFLEGKAFRHGDIEDILADMLIRIAASEGGGVFDFFNRNVGEKFSGLDVKRTYFGNWLYPLFVSLIQSRLFSGDRCRHPLERSRRSYYPSPCLDIRLSVLRLCHRRIRSYRRSPRRVSSGRTYRQSKRLRR